MQVGTVLDQIDLGAVALPVFQRGYVWNRDQVRGLMDSLYRGHPVGSLLTWLTKTETASVRGDGTLQPGYVSLLLDGQQRITSLYGIIRGKSPRFFEGNSDAFTGLQFNFINERFQFYSRVLMEQQLGWVSVTKLMLEGTGEFNRLIYRHPELEPNAEIYTDRLSRVASIKGIDLHTEVVSGEDKSVDTVVEIFNRVNSSGTKLSKGDLALAKVCAGWPKARVELNDRLKKWRQAGYYFKLDWLLRCVTCLLTGNAMFSSLSDVSTADFQSGLDKAEHHIDYLLNLISSRLGLDHARVLGSPYSFPILVRYLEQRGGSLVDHQESDRLLYWYIHTFLWGRFSGATESMLNQDLEAIKEIDGGLDRLIENLRRVRGELRISPTDFIGWSVGSRFYPLLYMLTRVHQAKDWCTGIQLSHFALGHFTNLQIHHIFPKSRLYAHQPPYDRREVNALANFTFLTQSCNAQVSNNYPAEYIPQFEQLRSGVVASHWMPMDPALWELDRYPDFLSARRELLAAAANEFLDSLREGSLQKVEVGATVSDTDDAEHSLLASQEEDKILLEANIWVTKLELPEGEFSLEIVDELTGALLATLDLAWPDGMQQGLSQPVALLIDEDAEVEAIASQHGFSCFTDVESLKKYVTTQVLALEEVVGG